MQFRNTLYMLDLRMNLVSVAKISDMGYEANFWWPRSASSKS